MISQQFISLYKLILFVYRMGQDQSKLRDEIGQKYTIIKTISEGEYLVKRQKKGDELQLRVLSFLIEDQMQQYVSLLDRRKKIKNPHLLELVQYNKVVSQLMCSSTFKLKIVSELPFKTLRQDITQRSSSPSKRYFAEDQLWSILYSCCHALYGLYINRIPHQSLTTSQIYIDTTGIIKIADPILVNGTKNYLSLMNQQTSQSPLRYISPQLRNLVDDNNFYQYEKEKSDVFILAMIILEIGLLSPLRYYDGKTKRFNFQIIRSSLDTFQERYSRKFTEIVERMLVFDYNIRPTFAQNIQNIQEKTVRTNSNTSSKESSVLIQNAKEDVKSMTYPKKSDLNTVKERLNFDIPPQTVVVNPIKSVPSNSVHVQNIPTQANFFKQIPHQNELPRATFTASNYIPNVPLTQSNQIFSQVQKPLSNPSSLPQLIPQPSKAQENSAAPIWKFDTILKKQKEMNYTPYQQLADYSGNNSIPTTFSIPHKEQNTNKPIINDLFKPLQAPKLEHFSLNTYDFTKERRFSQAKFGGIQLGTVQTQKKNTTQFPLTSQKPQIRESPTINLTSKSSRNQEESITQNGIFVIEQNENGKYQGFKQHHQKNGIGRITYTDGGFYQGQWKNDRMDGFGKLYYPNGTPAYEGYWQQDEFNGTGRVYNDIAEDESTTQQIDYKDMDDLENKWVYYEGQFYKDLRHGKGIIKFFTGEKFIGNFREDIIEGQGSFYRKDGDIIHGTWHSNKFTSVQ